MNTELLQKVAAAMLANPTQVDMYSL